MDLDFAYSDSGWFWLHAHWALRFINSVQYRMAYGNNSFTQSDPDLLCPRKPITAAVAYSTETEHDDHKKSQQTHKSCIVSKQRNSALQPRHKQTSAADSSVPSAHISQ